VCRGGELGREIGAPQGEPGGSLSAGIGPDGSENRARSGREVGAPSWPPPSGWAEGAGAKWVAGECNQVNGTLGARRH